MHNLEVVGSNPAPATNKNDSPFGLSFLFESLFYAILEIIFGEVVSLKQTTGRNIKPLLRIVILVAGLFLVIMVALMIFIYSGLVSYHKDPPPPGWTEFKIKLNQSTVPPIEELKNLLVSSSTFDRVYALIKLRNHPEQMKAISQTIQIMVEDNFINEGEEHCFRCSLGDIEMYNDGDEAVKTLKAIGPESVTELKKFLQQPYNWNGRISGSNFGLGKSRTIKILRSFKTKDSDELLLTTLEHPEPFIAEVDVISAVDYQFYQRLSPEQKTRVITVFKKNLENEDHYLRLYTSRQIPQLGESAFLNNK